MTDTSQSSKAKADSRIVKTVRNLKVQSSDAKENNISNNSNDKKFNTAVKTTKKYKAYKIWTDRMVSIGSSNKRDTHTCLHRLHKKFKNITRTN